MDQFLKTPTGESFRTLNLKDQIKLVKKAIKIIEDAKPDSFEGDVDYSWAKKIILFNLTKSMTKSTLRGVKAIFLAVKMLCDPLYVRIKRGLHPMVIVRNSEKKCLLKISHSPELKDMFTVQQVGVNFGVNKELELYEDQLKEYIADLFKSNPIDKIAFISIQQSDFTAEKPFFNTKYGVIWNFQDLLTRLRNKKATKEDLKIIENFKLAPEEGENEPVKENVSDNANDNVSDDVSSDVSDEKTETPSLKMYLCFTRSPLTILGIFDENNIPQIPNLHKKTIFMNRIMTQPIMEKNPVVQN